jgi:hypothetical protein
MANLERTIWPPARGSINPLEFAHYVNQRIVAVRRDYSTLTRQQWDSYYRFAVVRNPWDRVYSWYRNVIRDPIHRQFFRVSDTCSFDEFGEKHLDCWALDSQLAWLTDLSGRISLDFIGRFEKLDEAFAHIQSELGIRETDLPNLLQSGHVDYRQYYSETLRRRVAKKYAEEIDMFEYRFA